MATEMNDFATAHPRSQALYERAKGSLLVMMGERQKAIEVYEKAEAVESDPNVRKKLEELQREQ